TRGQAAGLKCGEAKTCDDGLLCDTDSICKNGPGGDCIRGSEAYCVMHTICIGQGGSDGGPTCKCSPPYYVGDDGYCLSSDAVRTSFVSFLLMLTSVVTSCILASRVV
ncbi:hypothetical protein BaRGS_00020905, partial [Batillaria attramentaria]